VQRLRRRARAAQREAADLRRPRAASLGEVIAMHLNQAPAPVRVAAPSAPPERARLIEAMLDKDPGKRPLMADVTEVWSRRERHAMPYRALAVMLKEGQAWRVVLTRWSNGAPVPPAVED
jgi:hypothetical protein